MEFNKLLKKARKEAGLTQVELAEMLNVTQGTIANWERAVREPDIETIRTIAEKLKVPVEYFFSTEKQGETNYIEISAPKLVSIPVIGRVAAGLQCFADMQIEEYAPCDASLLHTGYDYVYLRVTGDSMEPELHEGDKVLVQVRDTVESGDYAVVIVDGDDGLVKKIEYSKTQLTLISENPYYPPRRFQRDEMNRVRIFGKVVGLSRSF